VINDVVELCKSVKFVLAALSDLKGLFENKQIKASSKLTAMAKKIYFLILWVNETQDDTTLGLLQVELKAEGQFQTKNLNTTNQTQSHVPIVASTEVRVGTVKPKIEELS